jgi:hypothetical protein
MDIEQHLATFAAAFVVPAKRSRWIELLARRGRNAFHNSSKLMDALDARYCVRVDGALGLDLPRLGVFYDFYSDPTIKTLADALAEGSNHDAIFSLEPGRLAIHFSHEGWVWLCRR